MDLWFSDFMFVPSNKATFNAQTASAFVGGNIF